MADVLLHEAAVARKSAASMDLKGGGARAPADAVDQLRIEAGKEAPGQRLTTPVADAARAEIGRAHQRNRSRECSRSTCGSRAGGEVRLRVVWMDARVTAWAMGHERHIRHDALLRHLVHLRLPSPRVGSTCHRRRRPRITSLTGGRELHWPSVRLIAKAEACHRGSASHSLKSGHPTARHSRGGCVRVRWHI